MHKLSNPLYFYAYHGYVQMGTIGESVTLNEALGTGHRAQDPTHQASSHTRSMLFMGLNIRGGRRLELSAIHKKV